jgi:signal transduction histidine kinase/ligand-binding sensor domain-containing protein
MTFVTKKLKAQFLSFFLKILYFYILWTCNSFSIFSQEKILRFEHFTVEHGLTQNTVQGIAKDKYGFMWFGTWEGLCRFDGYKFTVYLADNNNIHTIYNNRVQLLHKDQQENIWVSCSDTQICRYNYETDDFTRYVRQTVPKSILDSLDRYKAISFTYIDWKDYKWVVNQSYNRLTIGIPFNQIENMNKLMQINKSTGHQYVYRSDFFNKWALNDETIFSIYLDNNEILWTGTYSGGVNKADIKQKPFYHYCFDPIHTDKSIVDNKIRAICEDKTGILWIGTQNKGLTRIDRKTDTYTHFQHNQNNSKNSIYENEIRKIYNDQSGFMWFGSKGGLDRFDPKVKKFHHYNVTNSKLPHNWVYEIMEDKDKNLWIGTWKGMVRYDRKNDILVSYDSALFVRPRIRVIANDARNNLWVATEGGGLVYLKRDTVNQVVKLTATPFLNSPTDSNSLISNRIYALVIDKNGILWIGTNNGLNRFDPVNKSFQRFGLSEGLPDKLITGIICDRKGNIWISHKKGITRLDPKTFHMRLFSSMDGLQDNEFSENACYISQKTGELFFGGINGFNCFYADSLKDNPYLPKVFITDLQISLKSVHPNEKVNGRLILTKPIYLTKEIVLTHKDKIITIEFAGLHYSNPKGNKYAYMLEGYDKGWNYTNASKRQASYSDLDPNTYVFKVKASNNDGIWNPEPASLKIVILAPWWKTVWAKILFIGLVIGLIYTYYYYRESNYQKKQKELTKQVRQRTTELEITNRLLLERQARIEEQAEELRAHSDNLKTANDLLVQKQALIQEQAGKLSETNEELLILNSTKDRFFSIIAHDLRNPFHVVSGFSEILIKDYSKLSPEKIEKYLNLINTSARSGNNLLENLLQWSRSQTGHIPYEPLILNLWVVAKETLDLLEGEALKKNIQVQLRMEPHLNVIADENMLKTIMRNLLSNAIKFTDKNGSIVLNAKVKSPFIEICVSDTGIGISKEHQLTLFRVDSNISTKGTSQESGTGLGLILCKEFIEKHNGRIWVESEEGKGSTFTFNLLLG